MAPRADGSVETLDRICFVHWSGRPDPAEVQRVADGIIAARRTVGQPLVLIAIVPPDADLPGKDALDALHRLTPIVDRMCDVQFAVFQGESMKARLVRATLITVGTVMRSALSIVADVQTALERAAIRIAVPSQELLARARERGIVD